jgi:hypothetical protein
VDLKNGDMGTSDLWSAGLLLWGEAGTTARLALGGTRSGLFVGHRAICGARGKDCRVGRAPLHNGIADGDWEDGEG